MLEKRDGVWWPESDVHCWEWLKKEAGLPAEISKFVTKKRVAVMAGGACGLYPKEYAGLFDRVYTFEPDYENFQALVLNLADYPNVVKFQACLGSDRGLVNLVRDRKNIGGHRVAGFCAPVIPVLRLDDLGLDDCDLIQLDVEGYEGMAIVGAAETIRRFRPVIAMEMIGNGQKYGWADSDVEKRLGLWGYVLAHMFEHDAVYVPKVEVKQ